MRVIYRWLGMLRRESSSRVSHAIGIFRPRYEYVKLASYVSNWVIPTNLDARRWMYAVWSELNIACETDDCRSEIENLRCRGGLHGNVDELFLTDARSDDEDDDDGNPSVIFVA